MGTRNEAEAAAYHRGEYRPSLRRAFSQLRIKITLPYALLAVAIAFAATYLITRLLVGLLENRFETALLDAGHTATDTVVRVEQEQLAAWRAIAYTTGFAQAVAEGSDDAALLAAPHAVNSHLDCLDVLDVAGGPLVAMHRRGAAATDYDTAAGDDYASWEIVSRVLDGEVDQVGDKIADLVETDWGWVLYTAGPIRYEGETVGVLLTGTYLDDLVKRLDSTALARISVYQNNGPPLATTFPPEELELLTLDPALYQTALAQQEQEIVRRDVTLSGRDYAEVLAPFEVRRGHDLGALGVALPLRFVTDASHPARQQLFALFGVSLVLTLLAGVWVSSAVVRRVHRLATATHRVAQGELDTRVEMKGHDEISELAHDFDRMVAELQEGRLYRDLLGLTAGPEVARRLREEVRKGILQLEAQSVVATVLFIDIRDFTHLSEGRDPAYVLDFLNEYLQGLVRSVRDHNGVINKFIGDAALAFFGVLPEAGPPEESARNCLDAALEIKEYLRMFNRRRQEQGEEIVRVGIGINTGPVVAGALGSEERFEYTILGDTVNVAQRLSDLSKEYPAYEIFASRETYRLLGESISGVLHLGEVRVKGRAMPVDVVAIPTELEEG